jgi:hypothetical protein
MNDKEIINYYIVAAATPTDVSKIVREWINDNWQPYGPLLWCDSERKYAQAVVKYR